MKYRPFEDLYKQVLVQEMNQKVIDYISERRTEPLPWDNLFGENNRVIIPLDKSTKFSPIIDKIKNLPNFYEFDTKNERVVFKKPRDPELGRGSWYLQPKSIGSVINDLQMSTDRKNYELDLYARYKEEFLKEVNNPERNPEYSIVLSRSPNDVIRMSDWPALESCLSKTGCNFHRVAHEAIKGGGVAFLVKNKYLSDFRHNQEFLKGEDTFSDDQRELQAVQEPDARLRLRRFVSNKGMDFAVPENSIFGNSRIPNFYESVVKYLKPRQPNEEEVRDAFRNDEVVLKGSSYGMEDLEDMLGEYFQAPSGAFVNYDKEDEATKSEFRDIHDIATDDAQNLEMELQDIEERFPLQHAYAGYDVDDDGEGGTVYYHYYGGISFHFGELTLSEDVDEDLSDEYDINRRIQKHDNFGDFLQELSEKNFHGQYMTSYNYDWNMDIMSVGLTPSDSIALDSNTYEEFRYNIKMADDSHEDFQEEITQLLLNYDLIESAENRPGEYQRLRAEQKEENEWSNFSHESSLKNLKLTKYRPDILIYHPQTSSELGQLNDEAYFNIEFNRFCRVWKESIEDSLKESMLNIMDHNFRPPSLKSNMVQPELGLVHEAFKNHPTQRMVDFDIKLFLATDKNSIEFSNFSLTTNTAKDVAFELADYWDEMWPHMERMLTLIAWECIKQTIDTSDNISNEDNQYLGYMPKNLVNLQRIYGRYVDTSNIGKI